MTYNHSNPICLDVSIEMSSFNTENSILYPDSILCWSCPQAKLRNWKTNKQTNRQTNKQTNMPENSNLQVWWETLPPGTKVQSSRRSYLQPSPGLHMPYLCTYVCWHAYTTHRFIFSAEASLVVSETFWVICSIQSSFEGLLSISHGVTGYLKRSHILYLRHVKVKQGQSLSRSREETKNYPCGWWIRESLI